MFVCLSFLIFSRSGDFFKRSLSSSPLSTHSIDNQEENKSFGKGSIIQIKNIPSSLIFSFHLPSSPSPTKSTSSDLSCDSNGRIGSIVRIRLDRGGFPIFDLLDLHLVVYQLVDVGHHYRSLNVQDCVDSRVVRGGSEEKIG